MSDNLPTIDEVLERTDFKGGRLMMSTYYPKTNEFGWTPLEQVITRMIAAARLDELQQLLGHETSEDIEPEDSFKIVVAIEQRIAQLTHQAQVGANKETI